jgi:hypothetical protein
MPLRRSNGDWLEALSAFGVDICSVRKLLSVKYNIQCHFHRFCLPAGNAAVTIAPLAQEAQTAVAPTVFPGIWAR